MKYEVAYQQYKENPTPENWDQLGEELFSFLKSIIAKNFGNAFFYLEDCVGDVSIKILDVLRDKNNGIENIVTWTYAVAFNSCLDMLRARTSRREVGLVEALVGPHKPSYDDKIFLDQMTNKLTTLEIELTGLKMEGLLGEDIGRYLGVTEEAVKMKWWRVTEKLRTLRGGKGEK